MVSSGRDPHVRRSSEPSNLPAGVWIFGAAAFDCAPSVPGAPCDVAALRQAAAENVDKVETMSVTIDGIAVTPFRAASVNPFAVFYPENSLLGLPRGPYYPNVAEGYWLLINALPPGEHVIARAGHDIWIGRIRQRLHAQRRVIAIVAQTRATARGPAITARSAGFPSRPAALEAVCRLEPAPRRSQKRCAQLARRIPPPVASLS